MGRLPMPNAVTPPIIMPVRSMVVSSSAKDRRLTASSSLTFLLTSNRVVPSKTHAAYFGGATFLEATRMVFAACSMAKPKWAQKAAVSAMSGSQASTSYATSLLSIARWTSGSRVGSVISPHRSRHLAGGESLVTCRNHALTRSPHTAGSRFVQKLPLMAHGRPIGGCADERSLLDGWSSVRRGNDCPRVRQVPRDRLASPSAYDTAEGDRPRHPDKAVDSSASTRLHGGRAPPVQLDHPNHLRP